MNQTTLILIFSGALMLTSCATTDKASAPAVAVEEPIFAPLPDEPLPAQIIGEPRARIDASLKLGEQIDDGYVHYADGLSVRYEDDVAVELRAHVSSDLGCKETITALGFETERTPIMDKDGCHWPYDSARHGLGPDMTAHFEFKSRTITIKLRR